MATFYLDYEGGNDANDGTTFANRWKTITNGATAARIAPGDTIRIMASPDPTSLGNGTWTGGGRPATMNIASSTNATPIAITTSFAHGLVANDYVVVSGHSTNANANGVWKVGTVSSSTTFTIVQMDGANTTGSGTGGTVGTVTKANNCVVKLASPVTQNIALCGGLGQKPAWTASANAGAGQSTIQFKEGNSSANLVIDVAFTTGKAAYYTLPATLDLSGYQQVTFWVRQSSGTIGAAGATYLALCTDTTGDTVAHTCNVPALGATNLWVPVVVDLATNLNSAIRSVAFYVVTDNGAQTFQLDNIVACKAASSADSLNLTSLISKSSGSGDEGWYAVQSINYDVVMLANDNTLTATNANIRGYNGTSATVTTYKRETIKTVAAATSITAVQSSQEAGTAGNLITFSGGWNRTDMSTQTGQTWFDGQNGNGSGLVIASFNQFDRLNTCRYTTGISFTASNAQIVSAYATACGTNGIAIGSTSNNNTITDFWGNSNQTGMALSGSGNTVSNVKTVESCSNTGIAFSGSYSATIGTVLAGNSVGNGAIAFTSNSTNNTVASLTNTVGNYAIGAMGGANNSINGGSSSGASSGTILATTGGVLYLNNFTMGESTEVVSPLLGGVFIYSNRHDNTDGNNWVWNGAGTINQQTSVVDSPATTSWKMNPTNSSASGTVPVKLKLGTVVCGASALVTVTARMRRDNTGLTMRLCCPGGQISGVSSDVTSDMTAAANTWETVTITFTPTKAGGVDIYAYAFGGTTYSGYVCNLTASQA